MSTDPKRELLRHMVAAVAFRGRVAIKNAPSDFANFRVAESVRSPAEILAHIGDLLIGSHYLLRDEFVRLDSEPMTWEQEVDRFSGGVKELDAFLASDDALAHPVEKFVQGPIGDALTHVGQLIMLRRIFGAPVQEMAYFTAEIVPGEF